MDALSSLSYSLRGAAPRLGAGWALVRGAPPRAALEQRGNLFFGHIEPQGPHRNLVGGNGRVSGVWSGAQVRLRQGGEGPKKHLQLPEVYLA